MSCGLGAVILVFMLVKHNVDNSALEVELLEADLDRLNARAVKLRTEIARTRAQRDSAGRKAEVAERQIAKVDAEIAKRESNLSDQRSEITALEDTIKATEVPKKPDIIEQPQTGEETYLIGLRVEGPRIGILVDNSSSMTDERLIHIIRRKGGSAADKQSSPKWKRTKNVVQWLLARIPGDSTVSVIAFADQATHLGGKGWKSGNDARALNSVLSDLDMLVPEGPTNLQSGLEAMSALNPSNIYVVTDGLPTAGDSSYRSLNPFSKCSALWGGSPKISGECRARLFRHTVNETFLPKAVVNVILLPIEGDPEASNEFWRWTSQTRGLVISPAPSWP